jgi:hypothetical protein
MEADRIRDHKLLATGTPSKKMTNALQSHWASCISSAMSPSKLYEKNLVKMILGYVTFEHVDKYVQAGNLPMVQYMIDQGCAPHADMLALAIRCNHLHIVKYLHEQGIYVTDWHQSLEPFYPLIVAARCGQLDIMQFCYDCGADIHMNTDSALQWSAILGQTEAVKFLVELGANIHADHMGFFAAVYYNNLELTKYYIEQKTTFYREDRELYLAAAAGNAAFEVMEYLAELDQNKLAESDQNELAESDQNELAELDQADQMRSDQMRSDQMR